MKESVPTLFEWAGGTEALNRLTQTFYDKVALDRSSVRCSRQCRPIILPMSPPSSARSLAGRKPTPKAMAATARW
ncbi:hypothetical protein MESS2_370002 [Mesorhizobium metallidurans STM 2683]|uniref:Globin n=1 Tax=Mesorhizobium metallidurans STM 2683 TaxID=1297569 RepID=M5ERQ6_9HYPH|nr:hypothetical protein MESS2_370002 [Mesorhizobium metallidurans STM 2683]